jgi:hypothetical protein
MMAFLGEVVGGAVPVARFDLREPPTRCVLEFFRLNGFVILESAEKRVEVWAARVLIPPAPGYQDVPAPVAGQLLAGAGESSVGLLVANRLLTYGEGCEDIVGTLADDELASGVS